ncbi:transmembrane protein, putative (macronuclear) [Tetrahymena thermophila SB210]|uniref:Transmembrane protein, putative n=1 Tax=Tetrahymena thermophila (strain SB210) TaxID=312017 RepID=W7XEI0_TETTS|nr:transmembrane protein, putative [Tetrahymena thermophila SB210]EWS76107.1 transmembrane protein, putative [Tetrahymena thermophila SB210]|eukprot:XP_012651347.1 transmembrane protein, putative [Tetrahymena thermophila SB210]
MKKVIESQKKKKMKTFYLHNIIQNCIELQKRRTQNQQIQVKKINKKRIIHTSNFKAIFFFSLKYFKQNKVKLKSFNLVNKLFDRCFKERVLIYLFIVLIQIIITQNILFIIVSKNDQLSNSNLVCFILMKQSTNIKQKLSKSQQEDKKVLNKTSKYQFYSLTHSLRASIISENISSTRSKEISLFFSIKIYFMLSYSVRRYNLNSIIMFIRCIFKTFRLSSLMSSNYGTSSMMAVHFYSSSIYFLLVSKSISIQFRASFLFELKLALFLLFSDRE